MLEILSVSRVPMSYPKVESFQEDKDSHTCSSTVILTLTPEYPVRIKNENWTPHPQPLWKAEMLAAV